MNALGRARVEAIPARDEQSCLSLLSGMYPEVAADEFHSRLERMRSEDGYELLGVYEDDGLLGAAGFIRLTNLLYGPYMWVHDLVIHEEHRGCGLGTMMMQHLQGLAASEGREHIALAAHIGDVEAHRFYDAHLDYEPRGILFRRLVS